MKKLTRTQYEEVRAVLDSPGYRLVAWQQEMILESMQQRYNSTKEDHRFLQGRVDGAREMLTAPEILLKRKPQ